MDGPVEKSGGRKEKKKREKERKKKKGGGGEKEKKRKGRKGKRQSNNLSGDNQGSCEMKRERQDKKQEIINRSKHHKCNRNKSMAIKSEGSVPKLPALLKRTAGFKEMELGQTTGNDALG